MLENTNNSIIISIILYWWKVLFVMLALFWVKFKNYGKSVIVREVTILFYSFFVITVDIKML
jgi:hypothetical protein